MARVVPGGTVLLIITIWPSWRCGATPAQAARMWPRSAVKSSESGVPTVMRTARAPLAAAGSVEAVSRPAATPLATSSARPGSGIGQRPALTSATIARVGVDADHREAALREHGGDHAADVAESDDRDVGHEETLTPEN